MTQPRRRRQKAFSQNRRDSLTMFLSSVRLVNLPSAAAVARNNENKTAALYRLALRLAEAVVL